MCLSSLVDRPKELVQSGIGLLIAESSPQQGLPRVGLGERGVEVCMSAGMVPSRGGGEHEGGIPFFMFQAEGPFLSCTDPGSAGALLFSSITEEPG